MEETTPPAASNTPAFSWTDWIVANFLSILFLLALILTVYHGWAWDFGLSRKLSYFGFLSFFSMMLVLIRNPEIPKSSSSYVWVLFFLFLFSLFFFSLPAIRAFVKENKEDIVQIFQKKDIEIPGILKVTENVEKIQKLADESQKNFDGMKRTIEELNDISSFSISLLKAQADDRIGLDQLLHFSNSGNSTFSQIAKMARENLLRTEEHLNSLSSEKEVSFYFPNGSLASITANEISNRFNSITYRDEIWEFFDAMRKDNQIPNMEKLKFYFRIIKDPQLGKSVLAYRWATELIDSKSGWPFVLPGKKTQDWERYSDFQEWFNKRQK